MIIITNISKTFSGNQVLENISLDIEEGDVVALIDFYILATQIFYNYISLINV